MLAAYSFGDVFWTMLIFALWVISTTGGSKSTAQIEQAKALLDTGAITQQEFDALKAEALA